MTGGRRARGARVVLAALVALAPLRAAAGPQVPNPAGELEKTSAQAGAPFDGNKQAPGAALVAVQASSAVVAASGLAASAKNFKPTVTGPKAPEQKPWRPKGWIGPASTGKRPGYGRGLLGGLLGLLVAPLMFAWEAVETTVSMPFRMIKGLADGDWSQLLEPFRTAKNLVQDAFMTGVGMLSSATAPIWNAARPDERTDFQFVDHRLIFVGGPFVKVLDLVNKAGDLHWSAAAPSEHTIFMRRDAFAEPDDGGGRPGDSLFKHEYVHGEQWKHSFLWEKQNHDFVGKDYSKANKDLDWW